MLDFEYTLNNHFKFGYGPDQWFETRKKSDQIFQVQFGPTKNIHLNWPESNRQAAVEIYERLPHPISVLFSGGMDSEICVRSFLDIGLDINIYCLRMHNNLNQHDIDFVQKFSKSNGIKVELIDLNIEDFWQSPTFYNIVDPIQCVSPILACHLWLCDQVDGTPVIAQGEPHLKKVIPIDYVPGQSPYINSPWYLVESERLCSLYLHFILKNKPAAPGFFQYLPEQFLSYLTKNSILKNLIENQIIGKLGTRSSKNKIINQFYPEIEPRPKYTGFENIEELHKKKRIELAHRFPINDENFNIDYTELVRVLSANS